MVLAIGKRTGLRLKRKWSGFRWGHGAPNQRRPTEKRLKSQKAAPNETFGEAGDIVPTPIRSTLHLEWTECLKISNHAMNRQSYLPSTSPKKYGSCTKYAMITGINNYMSPVLLLTLRSINDLLIQPLHDRFCFRRNLEIVEAILNHAWLFIHEFSSDTSLPLIAAGKCHWTKVLWIMKERKMMNWEGFKSPKLGETWFIKLMRIISRRRLIKFWEVHPNA